MKLSLTLDYELYGDGSGDVFEHVVRPTEKILRICEAQGVKLTLFFEVIEYIRLKQEWDKGNSMGYAENPILAIEQQLQRMAQEGHDIQLHVHPQWVNAVFESGLWHVDFDNWRLGDFSVPQDYSIEDMLREGKQTIEALIRPVCPDYQCTILRAGGYNVLPSGQVYQAMVNVGLSVDSSVYPGGYEEGDLSRYDFRRAPAEKDFWPVRADDFCLPDDGSHVIEVPVFALPQRRLAKITLARLRSALRNRRSAVRSFAAKTTRRSLWEKIAYLLEKEAFTWDFCLFDMRLHRRFFRSIFKQHPHRKLFVLVGHPKGFVAERSFREMLSYANDRGFSFVKLRDAVSND